MKPPAISSIFDLCRALWVTVKFPLEMVSSCGEGGKGGDWALGLRLMQKKTVEQWSPVIKSWDSGSERPRLRMRYLVLCALDKLQ